jgi:beta-lactamase regulating signal transducer with metallopeptidase domain
MMLQYLLNTTAIWLLSLLVFDVFLRRESYHAYNRVYLLTTMLAGALWPLSQWKGNSYIRPTAFERPITQVIGAKEKMIDTYTPVAQQVNVQDWLMIAYVAGACFVILSLIVEVVKLRTYYRHGKKHNDGSLTIVETDREHAPFSLLNILFVNSKSQYTNDEWFIIAEHEVRHNQLLHFADVLLLRIAGIVFWFHPLVYVFNKRLLLVHEYQADNVGTQQAQAYGQFLIEQSILQSAPSLTHSFNRSPIKKRILMLTRKSSAISKIKMFVFIPLALVCIICFSQNSFSQKPKTNGNFATYRGNRIELSLARIDTVSLLDPVTGKWDTKFVKESPRALKLNGERIFINPETDSKPVYSLGREKLEAYVINSLNKVANDLADGNYGLFINNIVIDRNGKIAFYENKGLVQYEPNPDAMFGMNQNAITTLKVMEVLDEMMENLSDFSPATKDGKPVPYRLSMLLPDRKIILKDRRFSIVSAE